MSWVKPWLRQSDQFDMITEILRERGLLDSAQRTMATVTAASVLVPAVSFMSTPHPSAGLMLVDAVAVAFTIGVSVFASRDWPTSRQSQKFAIAAAAIIAGWSIAQPTVALAALGCGAMAINGGYIALFHGVKPLIFNITLAAAIAAFTFIRLAAQTNIGTAIVALWVLLMLNITLPPIVRGVSQAMTAYATHADKDALTGLFNRRRFLSALTRMLYDPPGDDTHVTLAMIDLDAFKQINDTFGHAAGDQALTAVAELLREHTTSNALLCRAGGEEFLVADISLSPTAEQIGAQLCAAIAALPHRMTASIGTTTAEIPATEADEIPRFIERLIVDADTAMYTAKRRGGNQAHHY